MESQEQESYSLRLEGNGISVTRDVGQATARVILDLILGGSVKAPHGNSAPDAPAPSDIPEERSRPALSLREFLEASEAKRNPDKITVIGRYILQHEGRHDFKRDDLKGRFRDAGEGIPANFGRDFNWAVRNGWIAEDPHHRGSYYVTKKGAEAIESRFSSDVRKKTSQKKGSSKRRPKREDFEGQGGSE